MAGDVLRSFRSAVPGVRVRKKSKTSSNSVDFFLLRTDSRSLQKKESSFACSLSSAPSRHLAIWEFDSRPRQTSLKICHGYATRRIDRVSYHRIMNESHTSRQRLPRRSSLLFYSTTVLVSIHHSIVFLPHAWIFPILCTVLSIHSAPRAAIDSSSSYNSCWCFLCVRCI